MWGSDSVIAVKLDRNPVSRCGTEQHTLLIRNAQKSRRVVLIENANELDPPPDTTTSKLKSTRLVEAMALWRLALKRM